MNSLIQVFAIIGVLALGLMGVNASAQNASTLTIVTPANETTVEPGQTLQVIVNATNISSVGSEAVLGSGLIGMTPLQKAGPQLVFSVTVPTNAKPGRYYLRAFGTGTVGGNLYSVPVSLVVPMATIVSALQATPSPLIIRAPGVQVSLDVTGVSSAGKFTFEPEQLSFASSESAIASVGPSGIVTAQAAGETQITVSYSNGGNPISVSVPVQVLGALRGDLNGDGRVDSADLNILDAALNSPANGPNDARDLNKDGVINALDARILTTLCTYPRCATHP